MRKATLTVGEKVVKKVRKLCIWHPDPEPSRVVRQRYPDGIQGANISLGAHYSRSRSSCHDVELPYRGPFNHSFC